jgi:hypothetical protein
MATVLQVQELSIKSWKPWIDQETDEPIRDNYGNHKGTVTFDEYSAQPVDATFKEPPAIGAKKYGSIEEYQTKAGKTRLKFKAEQRPKEGFTPSGSKSYQPRDDMAIRAQWAIGQAVSIFQTWLDKGKGASFVDDNNLRPSISFLQSCIEPVANELFAMVDRVKDGEPKKTTVDFDDGASVSDDELASLDQHYN